MLRALQKTNVPCNLLINGVIKKQNPGTENPYRKRNLTGTENPYHRYRPETRTTIYISGWRAGGKGRRLVLVQPQPQPQPQHGYRTPGDALTSVTAARA